MQKIYIVKDDLFIEHLKGVPHPESPDRLKAIYGMLKGLEGSMPLFYTDPKPAAFEDIAMIHDEDYLIELECIGLFPAYLDPDTVMTQRTLDAAKLAAGGLIKAVSMVMSEKDTPAFALIRPPGHHAERDRGMGFCLFNNIAIAARYVQKAFGIKRVLICDYDVHHGNGTQHAFYNDPSVLYFSIHQYPHYPGTGRAHDTGTGEGEGYNINCPLPSGQGDAEYLTIFDEILIPITLAYQPELILVSAGFDAYFLDPLAGMRVTEDGFASMTQRLLYLAHKCCYGRLIFTLEGGYHLKGLTSCIFKVLDTLSHWPDLEDKSLNAPPPIKGDTREIIDRIKLLLSEYWNGIER